MPSPIAVEVLLSAGEREQLESWARRGKSAQALAQRSRIVLAAAEGLKNTEISQQLSLDQTTVRKWRSRFARDGLDGLVDEPRPGKPRTITDQQVEEVIIKTLESTPKNATHWSTRSMASEVGLSQTAVSRIWRAFGLQPHRSEHGSSPRTRSSWPRSAMSSVCISIRLSAQSFSASMRSPRSRRSTAPHRSCRCSRHPRARNP